jgi:hypothetical protein
MQPLFQELEMRIDTQKQTLNARDESIKKLLEMLQNKGEGQHRISNMEERTRFGRWIECTFYQVKQNKGYREGSYQDKLNKICLKQM